MFSLTVKAAFIFFVTVSIAFANEHESKEAATPEGPQNKPSEESFTAIQARVASLEAKVRSGEAEIQKLINEKQHTKDADKLNEIIRQMITAHKEMEKNAKEYDQQKALLMYRYPEKGLSEKREYQRIQVKPLEEMERQASIGTSLNRTLKKVRSQYPTATSTDPVKQETKEKLPFEHNKPVPTAVKPGLADPIILKK
ncbi:MAG: hypothetical protein ACXVCP_13000 [Bdellovibrio sp.]